MAILFQDGCDLYGTYEVPALLYGWTRADTNSTCSAAGGRFGGGALNTYYNSNWWGHPFAPSLTVWLQFSVKYDEDSPDIGGALSGFHNGTAQNCGHTKLNGSTRFLEIYDAHQNLQATSTWQVEGDKWHAFQMKLVVHPTAGSIEVYRGVDSVSATNIDTEPSSGAATCSLIRLRAIVHAKNSYYDDILVWDDQGSYNNDWTTAKDIRIDTLRPDADTAQEDFDPLGAGDQYVEVDDDPNNDGDTSYNESNVSGDKDRLALTTISGTPDEIFNVRSRIVAKKTNAGLADLKVGVYSGATEDVSAAQSPSTDYGMFHHDNEINPDDSLAWEVADIDDLEVQYEHA